MDQKTFPIADLHCDLLAYLAESPQAKATSSVDIGCSIPRLREGRVGIQVLAIYSAVGAGSTRFAAQQVESYCRLLSEHQSELGTFASATEAEAFMIDDRIGVVAAIENASGLCEEEESLDRCFERLDNLIERIGPLFYVSLTHNDENRFGGGNFSEAGLKADGRVLLDRLHKRGIAIDLSHTSDALAHGILNHIDGKSLDIPVIASHSNYREVFSALRNLPDELAVEVAKRGGLIGVNFLRAFLHPEDPGFLVRHVEHALKIGVVDTLCFGADFYATGSHPDRSRVPFFFPEHEHAGMYQEILQSLKGLVDRDTLQGLAHAHVLEYLKRTWKNLAPI